MADPQMVQSILMTGTILASSIGCALAALVLGSAIKSGWKHTGSGHATALEFVDARACKFRGYDSPELCQEDYAARSRHAGDHRQLH
jgi:hypothetical protein